ncbi:MAG: hypothetical protein ABIG10_04060 [bacterium]
MKKVILLSALAIVLAGVIISTGTAKTKSYYSGDAINYNGQILIATTNTGSLEIFKLDNNELKLITKFRPEDIKWNIFYDAMFDQENGRLYLYVTSGRYLYKYDATNPDNMILRKQIKDNSWDWFGALDKVDGRLATKGTKFIKIWNSDLQVIDSFRFVNKENPYNIRFGYNHNYIFNIINNKLQIFDRKEREIVRNLDLKYSQETGNRQLHADSLDNMLYVVDDEGLKKFGLFGGFYKILKHNSGFGYDVIYSSDSESVYFSNGIGVYKAKKSDLSLITNFDNSEINIANSWAMGLKRIQADFGEIIVVFNNSNILVLNNELKPIAKAIATEEDTEFKISELWLNVDKNNAYVGQVITVNGGGFIANEDLKISLEKRIIEAKTDNNGTFSAIIRVPEIIFRKEDSIRKDIKVVGQKSGLSYSIAITIDKPEPIIEEEIVETIKKTQEDNEI